MIVAPGPASVSLGYRVARELGVEVVRVKFKTFPDGESYIRFLDPVEGEDVAIIQSTHPPQDTNLLRLLLMSKTAKRLGARSVVAVVPYLAYARQDKEFLEGEAVSVDVVIGLIEASGVDEFLTFDIHSMDILERFSIPAKSLSAIPALAEHVRTMGLSGALSVAPDEGAIGLAKAAAEVLGGGWSWMRKERDRVTGEIRMWLEEVEASGRDVAIFDDIISTGGTMARAVSLLKSAGARRVVCACTHPLLVGDALSRILGAGCDTVIGTDCVPSPISVVSVSGLIAEELRRMG